MAITARWYVALTLLSWGIVDWSAMASPHLSPNSIEIEKNTEHEISKRTLDAAKEHQKQFDRKVQRVWARWIYAVCIGCNKFDGTIRRVFTDPHRVLAGFAAADDDELRMGRWTYTERKPVHKQLQKRVESKTRKAKLKPAFNRAVRQANATGKTFVVIRMALENELKEWDDRIQSTELNLQRNYNHQLQRANALIEKKIQRANVVYDKYNEIDQSNSVDSNFYKSSYNLKTIEHLLILKRSMIDTLRLRRIIAEGAAGPDTLPPAPERKDHGSFGIASFQDRCRSKNCPLWMIV